MKDLNTLLDIKPGSGGLVNNYGIGSQVLINSDRIIFNARINYLMLFGEEGVAISSPGNVNIDADDAITLYGEDGLYLGVPGKGNTVGKITKAPKTKADPTLDSDYEPIPLGSKLVGVLEDILVTLKNATILTPTGKAYFKEDVIQDLRGIQARLPEILSTNVFVDGISHEAPDAGPSFTTESAAPSTNVTGATLGTSSTNVGGVNSSPTTQINNTTTGVTTSTTGSDNTDVGDNYHQSVDIYKDILK